MQVVGADAGEVEVGQEHRRPSSGHRGGIAVDRTECDIGGHDRGHDDQGACRQDASHPSAVEGGKRGARRRRPLPQEQPGDHEARDDEEDVDADVAAVESGQTGVEEHDEHHGHRTQALDVGAEPAVTRCGACLVSRACRPGDSSGIDRWIAGGVDRGIAGALLLLFAGHRGHGVVPLLPRGVTGMQAGPGSGDQAILGCLDPVRIALKLRSQGFVG